MNQIAKIAAPQALFAPRADLNKTIVQISVVLPPKLSEDMSIKKWVQLMAEIVGDHPPEVLSQARDIVLSTCAFAPTPKEFVDAVLAAYVRCKVPYSDDAKRHLAYRKKPSARYAVGEDGKQRFAADAKLTAIAFVSVAGVHGNMVMENCPEATVADVEKALVATARHFERKDKATISEVLRECEFNANLATAYRVHGAPADLCGGPVATSRLHGEFRSLYLDLSESFVSEMLTKFPQATAASGKSAVFEVFQAVAYEPRKEPGAPPGYGSTYQAEAEQRIIGAMRLADATASRDLVHALNRDRRIAKTEEDKELAESRLRDLKMYVEECAYNVRFEHPVTA